MSNEAKYTERQMQDRLAFARGAAREQAWRDLMRRFTLPQRQRLAHLLWHDFTIKSIEIEDRYGSRPNRLDGEIPRASAIKDLDDERDRLRELTNPSGQPSQARQDGGKGGKDAIS